MFEVVWYYNIGTSPTTNMLLDYKFLFQFITKLFIVTMAYTNYSNIEHHIK